MGTQGLVREVLTVSKPEDPAETVNLVDHPTEIRLRVFEFCIPEIVYSAPDNPSAGHRYTKHYIVTPSLDLLAVSERISAEKMRVLWSTPIVAKEDGNSKLDLRDTPGFVRSNVHELQLLTSNGMTHLNPFGTTS
jgi:hypothetical protein